MQAASCASLQSVARRVRPVFARALKEAGLDVVADGWNVFFAPASMPAARVRQLGSAIEAIMKTKECNKKFRDANMDPVAAGPEASRR